MKHLLKHLKTLSKGYLLNHHFIDLVSDLIFNTLISVSSNPYSHALIHTRENEILHTLNTEPAPQGLSHDLLVLEGLLLERNLCLSSLMFLSRWIKSGVSDEYLFTVHESIEFEIQQFNKLDYPTQTLLNMFLPSLDDHTFYVDGTEKLKTARLLFNSQQTSTEKLIVELRRFLHSE